LRLRVRRPWALALLGLAVLAVHGCGTQWLADHVFDRHLADQAPTRMEVAYVREMPAGQAPPAAAAPAAPPVESPAAAVVPPTLASAPEPAASGAPPKPRPTKTVERNPPPAPAEPAAAAVAEPAPEHPRADPPAFEPAPEPAVAAAPAEPVPAAASAAASAAAPIDPAFAAPTVLAQAGPPASAPAGDGALPPFDWPVSTRMSYRLSGNVRGEVHGDAQVEWIRVDRRYQVHLDVTVGLSVAPLMTRRMSSDGDITAEGLSPRRYDQDTKVGFGARQRVTVLFEPGAVVLAGGQRRERWPGMQDTASQFIQLIYLFGTRPELLRAGHTLEVPLALPRNTSRWAYDVIGEETVHTPIGAIETFHLKPRRAVVKGGDLSAEIWFAPAYRYLPVRIRIQQDAETFIDLVVARPPELAAR
jgi:Protein of unknown function (DUF3108)